MTPQNKQYKTTRPIKKPQKTKPILPEDLNYLKNDSELLEEVEIEMGNTYGIIGIACGLIGFFFVGGLLSIILWAIAIFMGILAIKRKTYYLGAGSIAIGTACIVFALFFTVI